MRLKTIPHGQPAEVHWGSDVESLGFDGRGLAVRIAREVDGQGRVRGLDIVFADACAFRLLDEVELARYWASDGFVRGYPVLEVVEGGWCDEEAALQRFESRRREWLVVTGNGCVSVFAPGAPTVVDAEWRRGG